MAGLCEGGNEPSGSLKAICNFIVRGGTQKKRDLAPRCSICSVIARRGPHSQLPVRQIGHCPRADRAWVDTGSTEHCGTARCGEKRGERAYAAREFARASGAGREERDLDCSLEYYLWTRVELSRLRRCGYKRRNASELGQCVIHD
ncbi:hypothetical protein ANN_14915 [Periplaneta americana]|uniref:Uncharacterized protein n=1 Tax=Periplaneta americana TaxID=6978 RepID=A0ABQ8SZ05_PERAM|nr:hypothetical protein ANN_14915 [Periplaneta americana]